ncbi:beta strand repeat-containing protein, partial [Helicobacter brantae]
STTTIGNPTLTLDSSKNLNVNIDSTSSLTLASVTTSNGTLSVNTDDSLNGTLTLAGLTNETGAINNTINVSTLNLSGELSVDRGATNTIKANSITLSGGVISKNHTSDTKNTIIANSIEFATSSSVYAGYNGGKTTKNLFDISGDAKFGNSSLTIIANNNYTDDSANRYKQNIFKFGGKVEGVVDEVTATVVSGDANTRNTANILSFEGSNPQSLTITDVNKADTLSTNGGDNGAKIYANGKSGNIYIGKNLTLNSGATLALKSAFNDSNWSDATYQASNLTLTIQNLNTNGGKNYINVGTLYIGDDAHDGSISASGGGVNNIALGKNSKIKGNITIADSGQNNIVIQGSNATLTLEGKDTEVTTHAITTLNASGANTTLVLDNSNVTTGAMSTTIGTLNGTNLTATLKGKDTTNSATLALNGGTLKALTLGETSTGNILDLSNATSTLSITNQINVENNQDLTIKLKNTTLALNGGLSTSGNGSKIELVGDTSNTSNATLTGGAVALSNLALSATDSNTLTISSSSAVIDSISASGTTSNTIALNGTRTTITSAINVNDKPLSFEVTNSTLVFGSSDNTITSLTSNGGLVDLSVGVKPQTPYAMARSVALASNGASARNTLTINDTFTGEATFKLYASQTQSDRVEFGASQANPYNVAQPSTPSGVAIISITGGNDVFSITESDKVIVATRTDNSVEIVGGESYIGGAKVGVTIGAMDTDANTFIIKNTREIEADPIYQEVASSALAVNYDLYLANFNSLNKRMGELRDDDHNQGVWARVFGGNMSNDFGAGSKTDYLTAQAGYDYSLSVGENARNYMGIALAYGTSSTKGNSSYASNSNNAGLSLDKV